MIQHPSVTTVSVMQLLLELQSTDPEELEPCGGSVCTHRSPRISSLSPSWHFHLRKGSKKEVLVFSLEDGAGRKAGDWSESGDDAGLSIYVPTKVKRSMGGRTQQIRLRLSPTFPRIFAKSEGGKLIRSCVTNSCKCFGHPGPARYSCA